MRTFGAVALCGLLFAACDQGNESNVTKVPVASGIRPSDVSNAKVNEVIPAEPQVVERAMLGSDLGTNGMVAKDTDKIDEGQPVYFTMVFLQSPHGLQASTVLTTIDKQPVRTVRKDMNGAKIATFDLGKDLKAGRYKVVGYWGGNIAAEREFEVVGPKSKGKRG